MSMYDIVEPATAAAEALAPDLIERTIFESVGIARKNPYIAATLTLVVSGYAIWKAVQSARPVVATAYNHAMIRMKRLAVAVNTPLPAGLGGPKPTTYRFRTVAPDTGDSHLDD